MIKMKFNYKVAKNSDQDPDQEANPETEKEKLVLLITIILIKENTVITKKWKMAVVKNV